MDVRLRIGRFKKPKKSSPSFSFSFSNFPKLNFSLWGFEMPVICIHFYIFV